MLAGVAAYGLWGLFPLLFHQLSDVAPGEVLMHRVLWSFVVVAGGAGHPARPGLAGRAAAPAARQGAAPPRPGRRR